MMRFAILSAFLGSALLGVSAGCVNPPDAIVPQQVTVEGTVSFAGTGHIAVAGMDLRVTAQGAGLFEESPTCQPADLHVPGTMLGWAAVGSSGQYSYTFETGNLHAAIDEACTLGPTRLDQADVLEIEAGIPADAGNCEAYCAGYGTSGCEQECAEGGRRIIGKKLLPLAEVMSETGEDLAADAVAIRADVTLDTLGPTVVRGSGPDLQVDGAAAARSARIAREYFAAGDCAIVEGCVPVPGSRRVLRFDGVIRNMGDEDFVLGGPQGNPLFHFSSCHGHYHLSEAMKYELLDASLRPVTLDGTPVVGHKQGFCMIDMIQVAGTNGPKFTCSYQGLTSGWADVYGSSLDCQFVDITGVAPGDYVLKITVNPGGTLGETDKTNNSALVPVSIPAE